MAVPTGKKAYQSPRLRVYGPLVSLTGTTAMPGGNDMLGMSRSMTVAGVAQFTLKQSPWTR